MYVPFKIDAVFIRYFCTIFFTYILELIIITYLNKVLGYPTAFIAARFVTAPLFFSLARYFVFKSKNSFWIEFKRFSLLLVFNMIVIECYLSIVDISSDLFFVLSYTLVHGLLFVLNYLILNYKIFIR